MSKLLRLLIILLSFMGLVISSESTPTDCDYLLLLDDYDFSILNCTFTPKDGDARLEIYYKVTRDQCRAN